MRVCAAVRFFALVGDAFVKHMKYVRKRCLNVRRRTSMHRVKAVCAVSLPLLAYLEVSDRAHRELPPPFRPVETSLRRWQQKKKKIHDLDQPNTKMRYSRTIDTPYMFDPHAPNRHITSEDTTNTRYFEALTHTKRGLLSRT